MKALVAYSNNATELGSRELRIIVLAGRMVKLGSQGLGAQRAGVSVLEWASRSWSGRAGVGVLEWACWSGRAGVGVLEWASRCWSGRAGVGVLEWACWRSY